MPARKRRSAKGRAVHSALRAAIERGDPAAVRAALAEAASLSLPTEAYDYVRLYHLAVDSGNIAVAEAFTTAEDCLPPRLRVKATRGAGSIHLLIESPHGLAELREIRIARASLEAFGIDFPEDEIGDTAGAQAIWRVSQKVSPWVHATALFPASRDPDEPLSIDLGYRYERPGRTHEASFEVIVPPERVAQAPRRERKRRRPRASRRTSAAAFARRLRDLARRRRWEESSDFEIALARSYAEVRDWQGFERVHEHVLSAALTKPRAAHVRASLARLEGIDSKIERLLRRAMERAERKSGVRAVYVEYYADDRTLEINAFLCNSWSEEEEGWAADFASSGHVEGPSLAGIANVDGDERWPATASAAAQIYVRARMIAAFGRAVDRIGTLRLPIGFAEHGGAIVHVRPSSKRRSA